MTDTLRDVLAQARQMLELLESGALAQPLIDVTDVTPALAGASLAGVAAASSAVAPTTIDEGAAPPALELPAAGVDGAPGPPGPAGPAGPGVSVNDFEQLRAEVAQLQELALLGIMAL
jgi:hypothetical protein